MQLPFKPLLTNVALVLEAGRVPMITSPPGVGKSALGRKLAEMYNLLYIDIRLTNYNVTTLNGFPSVDAAKNVSRFVPIGEIPIQGRDEVPTGYKGWLINFDELPACTPELQAAAYRIILDRELGQEKVHDDVYMMACGNGLKDGAVAKPISTALKSRMSHFQLMSDPDGWMEYASASDFYGKVIDFIGWKREMLNNFDPKSDDYTYACERSWEMLSDIMHCVTDLADIYKYSAAIHGTVGMAAGSEFIGFLSVYDKITPWNAIESAPESAPIPSEPSVRAAMTQMFVDNCDYKNFANVGKYIKRLPPENQMLILRRCCAANTKLRQHPLIEQISIETGMNYDFM